MPNTDNQIAQRSRWLKRTLISGVCLFALALLYIAGIGPLCWMESRKRLPDDTLEFWRRVYRPVLVAWRDGPEWLNVILIRYTETFDLHGSSAYVFGPVWNNDRRGMIRRIKQDYRKYFEALSVEDRELANLELIKFGLPTLDQLL